MKNNFSLKGACHLFITALMLSLGAQSFASDRNWYVPQSKSNLFTLLDAEKILGEKAHMSDSSVSNKNNVSIFQCAYLANSTDAKSGKTGNIYVMIEDYSEIESAKKTYSGIMESNRKNGISELKGLGDEAYFHTDKE